MAHKAIRHRHFPRCAFCSNKADSKEHAWEDWAIEHLRTKDSAMIGHLDGHQIFEVNQRAIRIKCLCHLCNTVWLKSIVDSSKPLIGPMMHDIALTLDIQQQRLLAIWAMSRAMVWEHISSTPRPIFYSDKQRSAFRINATIPKNTWIWLARFGGTAQIGVWVSDYTIPLRQHVTTVLYGHLVVQINTVRPDMSTPKGTIVHPKRGRWPETQVDIWPATRVCFWPPRMTTDVHIPLRSFVERWDHHGPEDLIRLD